MSLITQPMLAGKCEDPEKLCFPVLATPKLDGIRALMIDGKILSRKWKDIPNEHVQRTCSDLFPQGMDGELMVVLERDNSGAVTKYGTFNQCQSAIMSEDGTPDFVYMIFDWVTDSLEEGYRNRVIRLRDWYQGQSHEVQAFSAVVDYTLISYVEELTAYEKKCLDEGFEGVMVRTPGSPYKCGRSSTKQGYLLKIKQFETAEAKVIDFVERMHNANEKQQDAFGRAKRSSHKANKFPMNTLGALVVEMDGVQFEIGTGFDDVQREEIWQNRDRYKGMWASFKSQPFGKKDKPRFPVWLGWRHENDMSEG